MLLYQGQSCFYNQRLILDLQSKLNNLQGQQKLTNFIIFHKQSMPLSLQKKQRSITQQYNPKYRKVLKKHEIYKDRISQNFKLQTQNFEKEISVNENENLKKIASSKEVQFTSGQTLKRLKSSEYKGNKDNIQQMTNQIKNIFFRLDLMIQKSGKYYQQRMKTHQNQLIKIVFSQIQRIQQECEKTTYKYNKLIKRTMNNEQLAEARQQIQFFKQSAVDLNIQNQNLKKEIKHLKKIINQMEIKIKSQNQVIQSLSYKLIKYKAFNKQKLIKIHQIQHGQSSVSQNQLQKSLSLTTPSKGYVSGRQTQKMKPRFNISLTPINQLINHSQKLELINQLKNLTSKNHKFSNIQKQIEIKFNINKQKQKFKSNEIRRKMQKQDQCIE